MHTQTPADNTKQKKV